MALRRDNAGSALDLNGFHWFRESEETASVDSAVWNPNRTRACGQEWELSSYGPKTLPDSCPERDRIVHKLGWHVLEDGISPPLVWGYATPVLGTQLV